MTAESMWERYLHTLGEDRTSTRKTCELWYFSSDEKNANELAEMTKKGKKRATTGLLGAFEFQGEPLPKTGDLHIITDWNGNAACVIQLRNVSVLPFAEVKEEYAKIEGEGDGSLSCWREVHYRCFTQDAAEMGMVFTEDLEVVCMVFKVVYV